ncbi:MAG: diaminopimelate decarboxylase [Candidatus Omnitrophica bacterium]|nr:diaminopimelate decarboxylase [Candidatus Omnitrophota bacterium]MDD5429565.1 diaminopimelate decarboxylase [Candidatus Omnitrophota bacterium]
MHHFIFKNRELYCEGCKAKDLAKEYGTPLYVYSRRTLTEHFDKIKKAFRSIKPVICYSVKANSNLTLLKLIVAAGGGLDIVSGGELYRAKKVKCPPERIVYASVGKTDLEIQEAISYGILMFNVESTPELHNINRIASRLNKKVRVALRFNPDVKPKTHSYIITGKKETKFGMDSETLKNIFLEQYNYPNIKLAGIHMHIGSQISQAGPFIKAIGKVKKIITQLRQKGIIISYLNIGGGLGIVYNKEKPQTAGEFANKVLPLLKGLDLKVLLEPGRFIAGNSGIFLTKVIYVKNTPVKKFFIVDGAMNDLLRPSLYGAYHDVVTVNKNLKSKTQNQKLADVVGPICESGDFLAKDRSLEAKQGDYLAVMGAGAYGFSMSSNYNSRRRPAEVLVDGKTSYIVRRRESYQDLTGNEVILKKL